MNLPYRHIAINEEGLVVCYYESPVEGVTIDTEGMTVHEMPTDAIYALYYNETEGLHWVKTGEFEPDEPTSDENVWDELDKAYQRGVDSV